MPSRSITRPTDGHPGNKEADASDPFTDLLSSLEEVETLETEDTLAATPRDLKELHELFGAPAPPQTRTQAPPGSPWPGHNFGPAYDSLRREHPRRRRPTVLSESDLWDVDALTTPDTTTPHQGASAADPVVEPMPWRRPSAATNPPDAWLETLAGDAITAPTEAHLVDLIQRGPRPPVTVLDTTEILHADTHTRRNATQKSSKKKSRLVPYSVEIAALALILLFALAILQLLLS
jgi:hypothetical protein